MICTIGSLVQETITRRRWLLAASMYSVSCVGTATLLGASLGALGHFAGSLLGSTADGAAPAVGIQWLVGLLAVGYAVSDVGLVRLPRPTVMRAVPATWWRRWRPYRAAVLYGAALGVGVTTRIHFGAFYVLCVWCLVSGEVAYGGLLLGSYGAARALAILPASWGLTYHVNDAAEWLSGPLFDLRRAKGVVALVLLVFGWHLVVSAALR